MSKRLTTEQFISRAKDVHGDRYSYERTEYTRAHDLLTIMCRTHGDFDQRGYAHLQGQNCPRCCHNYPLTEKDVSTRSQAIYGQRFELIEGTFTGVKRKMTLRCPDHGLFDITPEVHFRGPDGGCPVCWKLTRINHLKPGNTSAVEKKWLDAMGVPLRQHRVHVGDSIYVVDGYDPATNTIYECYGSYWHGDPNFYQPHRVNPTLKVTFGELYERTMRRENDLRTTYNVETIWVR